MNQAALGNIAVHPHLRSVFDPIYYSRYAAEIPTGVAPLEFYLAEGERRGHKPSFVFDPSWYRRRYDVPDTVGNVLEHYLEVGERSGFQPSPHFDPEWYAQQNRLDLNVACALAHYLSSDPLTRAPHAYFSAQFYCERNRDIAGTGIDPYEHYAKWGIFEGRSGGESFDADYVWQRYLGNHRDKNALELYLEYGSVFGWEPVAPPEAHTVPREIRRSVTPGPDFQAEQLVGSGIRRTKALAFYLPQYHAIPENDAWWGKGFTEWRNVARGVPRFVGHYQPRIPRDLGFYELRDTAIIKTQIEMAKSAGIFGFCFYYYNFGGKRLLEQPLDAFVEDETIDFPFCLLWANENWSRRWDGMEHEVLIGQNYNRQSEDALIDDLARYMHNPRYVRIGDRPIFFVYRSDVIPDTKATVSRWRERFKLVHQLDPLIVMSQTFGTFDPRRGGFDGALEFPPHKYGAKLKKINHTVQILDDDFEGDVYSYDDMVEASLQDFPTEYPLIKTVIPSWDNDARKQGSGLVVHGSSPTKFRNWVDRLSRKIQKDTFYGEQLLVVNAWNEWCEGAYLEPDVHYGYAYINALARSLTTTLQASQSRRILLVGHDAFPAGAQLLLYNIGRTLKEGIGVEVSFILMDGGALVDQYRKLGDTFVADTQADFWPALRQHVDALRSAGYSCALTNSAFSGHAVDFLVSCGFRVTSLIHELKTIIQRSGGTERYRKVLQASTEVIFPNSYVRDELSAEFGEPSGKSHVIPQGLYKDVVCNPEKKNYIQSLLRLPRGSRIVLNVGYADLRKGVDLFISVAREMREIDPTVHFVWVGNIDPTVDTWVLDDVRRGRVNNVSFIGHTDSISDMFNSADLFFLTSREDPFPSVLLEALAAGLPVGALDTSGGFVDFISSNPCVGFLSPANNPAIAARRILQQLETERREGRDLGAARQSLISTDYNFKTYVFNLLSIAQMTPKLSVIVPNYNYKQYMADRLTSIFEQSHPIWEVIVLDDASTDDSVAELERLSGRLGRDFTLIENEVNSGNAFKQWRRGLEAASGDFIWIAEADDLSDPSFLDNLLNLFEDPSILFAFSDSRTIDERGVAQWDSYKGYYDTVFPGALSVNETFEATAFLKDYLSVKNVILNASAVVWRKAALAEALSRCHGDLDLLSVAGDWRIYVEACGLGGKIGYVASALNVHRRHSGSVTQNLSRKRHLAEIVAMHAHVARMVGPSAPIAKQREYALEIAREFRLTVNH